MPVEGFPEVGVDKKCMRCGTWFHPDEGVLIMPDVRGPFSQLRNIRIRTTGDESKMWFMCFKCQKIRTMRSRIIYIVFATLVAGILLLRYLGFIE